MRNFRRLFVFPKCAIGIRFPKETIERVQKLFTADLLRADKSTMAHGLETRVPFLDKSILDLAIKIQPEEKNAKTYDGIEKYILRKAFDTPKNLFLPEEIFMETERTVF